MPYKVELPPERSDSRLTGGSPISKIPVRPVRTGKERSIDDDPILFPGAWVPIFRELHNQVAACMPELSWLRANKPELYRAIRGKENELDALQKARLSEVKAIMSDWRNLVLKA